MADQPSLTRERQRQHPADRSPQTTRKAPSDEDKTIARSSGKVVPRKPLQVRQTLRKRRLRNANTHSILLSCQETNPWCNPHVVRMGPKFYLPRPYRHQYRHGKQVKLRIGKQKCRRPYIEICLNNTRSIRPENLLILAETQFNPGGQAFRAAPRQRRGNNLLKRRLMNFQNPNTLHRRKLIRRKLLGRRLSEK